MDSRDETVRFLRTLFAAGDVFEIRMLEAVTAEYQRPHAESGYFDYDHIPQAAEAISKLRSYSGAYVTLNPVNPALLGRANNRIAPARRDNSTADGDVLRRRWLPIDCDPVRPSGIASTDEEHEAALALSREIRDGLSSLGWPEPVMLDSGNGAQMLYRIDLPTDDNGLVKKCIEEIAKASTDAVKVDVTVFNAARIWRMAGTMNRKGDPLDDRPHRQARIVSIPKRIRAAGRTLMEAVCGNTVVETATETGCGRTECPHDHPHDENRPFDADRWISEHCPDIGTPKPWNGGRKWVFKVCPFNPAHSNGSAVLIQEASGAMAFRCHHNGCAGTNWQKLREMLEPGCYDRETSEPLPLDWHALGAKTKQENALVVHEADPSMAEPPLPRVELDMKAEMDAAATFRNPGKMPEELLHIPGFIDEYVECCMSSAPYPNRVISFCAALAFLSYIAGKRVVSDRNTLPNIYLIALADSGAGKDHPRKMNMAAAIASNLGGGIAEDFTSGSAIEDALYLHQAVLFQKDEIDTLFNTLKNSREANSESMIEKILRLYGSSSSLWKMRSMAMQRGDLIKLKQGLSNGAGGSQEEASPTIINPYLTVFGTAIPQFFYESLSLRMLGNGLVARCLILDAGRRGKPNRSKFITLTDSLKRSIEVVRGYHGKEGNLAPVNPTMMVLGATDEANALLDAINLEYCATYDKYQEMRAQIPMAFWARAFEKVLKLSMLHAISSNVIAPVVTVEGVEWARRFTDFLTEQMLYLAQSYSYENPFDEKCRKILRFLETSGGTGSHSALLKRSHESKETFESIMETLEETGAVTHEYVGTGGRMRKVYRRTDAAGQ